MLETGILDPGSISSCVWINASTLYLPMSITGVLAVSASDGNIDYITFD